MTAYETEFSNFPDELITLHDYINVTDDMASIVNQVNALRAEGQYAAAQEIIDANSDTLAKTFVDATKFRTWEEEIYNTQLYSLKKKQDIYFCYQEPITCETNDVWVSNYDDDSTDDSDDTSEDYQNGYAVGYTAGYAAGITFADARVSTTSASYIYGYNVGVADANDQVNQSSASYQSGYTTGYEEGYALGTGSISVYTVSVETDDDEQSVTIDAPGTVLCAGIKTIQYQVCNYDESDDDGYHEMTAYATCTYSGTKITVTATGGNQSNLERNLVATVSYVCIE